MSLVQDFQVESTEYSLVTIDDQFALFGGYSALVWSILSFLVSWH